jgi:hypothetical protein
MSAFGESSGSGSKDTTIPAKEEHLNVALTNNMSLIQSKSKIRI